MNIYRGSYLHLLPVTFAVLLSLLFTCVHTIPHRSTVQGLTSLSQAEDYVSVLGDPGMLSPDLRVMLEAWNFCNRCGPEAKPSPRWADCLFTEGDGPGPSGNQVTEDQNMMSPPSSSGDFDTFAVTKELYLGEICSKRVGTNNMPSSFWTIMLKNGNLDRALNLCKTWGLPTASPSPTPSPSRSPGSMNQPVVQHAWTSRDGDQLQGSFYGTYDVNTPLGQANSSWFNASWSRPATAGAASWVYRYELRTSTAYPWLMVYHRSDSVEGGSGGYPWDGRGILLEHPTGNDIILNLFLNVTYCDSPRAQFYLPELSGCWKPDGSPCDGDLALDTTRYVCFVINPGVQPQCSPNKQSKCPPYHRLASTGEIVYRNDTARFPYQCYLLWCAPPNIPGFSDGEYCDPRSNPNPQELLQLLPCSEWAEHSFPTTPGQGWIGDARKWRLNVGGLGQQLYFSGTIPSPRYWVSMEVGPEVFDANKTVSWYLQDWDVLVPKTSAKGHTPSTQFKIIP